MTDIQAVMAERELARRHLLFFQRYMFKYHYQREFVESWYHGYVAELMMACIAGELPRLLLNEPPSYGKCVSLDTEVITVDGIKTVEKLMVDELVLSHDNGKAVWKRCVWKEAARKESLRITTKTGRQIVCSTDHPMLTFEGYRAAETIKPGDFMRTLRKTSGDLRVRIKEDELAFVTLMLFDGECGERNIRFTKHDPVVLDRFFRVCASLGIEVKHYDSSAPNNYTIIGGKKGPAYKILSKYGLIGKLSKEKRLPQKFYVMPKRQAEQFIGMMIQTDGYISKNGQLAITLASHDLIRDIQTLLSLNGIVSYINEKKVNRVGCRAWELAIPREYSAKMGHIDFGSKQPQFERVLSKKSNFSIDVYPAAILDRIDSTYHARKNGFRCDNAKNVSNQRFEKLCALYPKFEAYRNIDFIWDKVVKVENVGVCDLMHLEIEDTHNFVANGMVSHNTEQCVRQAIPWALGRNPRKKYAYTTYGGELSTAVSVETRTNMDNKVYQGLFPDTKLSRDQNQKHDWKTTVDGGLYATSTGGVITGRHFDGIVMDDPIKAMDAGSAAAQKESINFYESSIITRLRDKKHGFIALVMQRLHVKDLAGYIIDNDDGEWYVACLRAQESRPVIYDFGSFHYERLAMEPLFPAYEDEAQLAKTRREMGETKYVTQYLHDPEVSDAGYVKEEWFSEIGVSDIPDQNLYIKIDPAMSTKDSADNRAIVVVGYSIDESEIELKVVMDCWYGTWGIDTFVDFIIDSMVIYPDATVLLESSGGGLIVEQMLKKEITRRNAKLKENGRPLIRNTIRVYAPSNKVSKNQKISAGLIELETGRWKFRRGANGIDQLKAEYLRFDPNKDHNRDDCIDASHSGEEHCYPKRKGIVKEVSGARVRGSNAKRGWRF